MRQRWLAVVAGAAVMTAGTGHCLAADLPSTVRVAANVDADKPQIGQYVQSELALVASGTKKGSDPRDDLVRQIEPTPTVQPSAQFVAAYLDAVANAMPTLAGSPDEQKRLQAAILLARLVNLAPSNPRLTPLVEKAIADKSSAVALWGIKSAGIMLPEVLKVPVFGQRQKLTAGIVAAVQSHPNVGPLVQDAYNALSLYDATNNRPFAMPNSAAYLASIDGMNAIMALRVSAYAKGVPPYPQAERIASPFFTNLASTNSIAAPQRLATTQQLINLMAVTAAQVPNAGGSKADLMTDVGVYAGLIDVLLGPGNRATAQLKPISVLKPTAANPNLQQMVDDAIKAVKTVPGYAVLKDPPTPGAAQNAPQPNAAPNAG